MKRSWRIEASLTLRGRRMVPFGRAELRLEGA